MTIGHLGSRLAFALGGPGLKVMEEAEDWIQSF